jgi:hypothetical protein
MGRPDCKTRFTSVWIWLSLVKYSVTELPPWFRAASRSSTTFRRRGSEVRTPISSLQTRNAFSDLKMGFEERSLLFWVYPVLLRCDEVKKCFGPPVKLVQLPVPRRLKWVRATMLIENCEKKGAVM